MSYDISDIPTIVYKMSIDDVLAYKTKTKTDNYEKYTYEERVAWSKNQKNMEEFKYNRLLNKMILDRKRKILSSINEPAGGTD